MEVEISLSKLNCALFHLSSGAVGLLEDTDDGSLVANHLVLETHGDSGCRFPFICNFLGGCHLEEGLSRRTLDLLEVGLCEGQIDRLHTLFTHSLERKLDGFELLLGHKFGGGDERIAVKFLSWRHLVVPAILGLLETVLHRV